MKWKIDECAAYFDRMKIRGWCFVPEAAIGTVEILFPSSTGSFRLASFGQPSPDVAEAVSREAHHVRFDEWIPLPDAQRGRDFTLRVKLVDGTVIESESVHSNARDGDPAHGCWYHFLDALNALPGGEVLEIGSRARSGITRRQHVPAKLRYVGLDIVAGENVDLVGDAHSLSQIFPAGKFSAIFSLAVFEHLAMPWKAAVEINRVLCHGGLVFVNTVQTWPVHEEPWDFFRFSAFSWRCLFNASTGFELIEAVHGEPARVHALWDSPVVRDMPSSLAYLSTAMIARKVAETSLDWPVPTEVAAPGSYPEVHRPRA